MNNNTITGTIIIKRTASVTDKVLIDKINNIINKLEQGSKSKSAIENTLLKKIKEVVDNMKDMMYTKLRARN